MRIEYVTHASLFIEAGGSSLLLDPFFFLDPIAGSFLCHFPHRDLKPDLFPKKIDAVYCSHSHDDHCHRNTLLKLKDRIKLMILPAGKPDFEAKIRSYGFERIFLLEHGISQRIGTFTLTSFHDKNGVDTALVIEGEGKTIFHQNDCRLDPSLFEEITHRFHIDYAFMLHTSCQELYPLLLPRLPESLAALCLTREEKALAAMIDSIRSLKPRIVIPYSYTLFYTNEDQLHLNEYPRATPPVFREKLIREIPDQECWILQPGDVIEDQAIEKISNHNDWGSTQGEYAENGKRFCQRMPVEQRQFPMGSVQAVEGLFRSSMTQRLKRPLPPLFNGETVALILEDGKEAKTFYVDTHSKELMTNTSAFPFLEITLPASIVEAVIGGRYDPFEILFSYRVTFQGPGLLLMNLSAEQECAFYVQAFIALMDDRAYEREFGSLLSSQQGG